LLTVLLQYSPAGLFHKIRGGSELPDDLGAEGDVLSHLGRYLLQFDCLLPPSFLRPTRIKIIDFFFPSAASPSLSYDGASTPIKVSLLPNPSHLGKFSYLFFVEKDLNPV
jgi:probable 2-oxoglutarate dehydrogenase E1 component DHKTD1